MRRQILAAALIGLALTGPEAPAQAQSAGQYAIDQCERAASRKARDKYNVDRAQILGRGRTRQISNAETGVSGTGQLDTRSGWVQFSYSCTYNFRNDRVTNISVKSSASSASSSKNKKDDSGKVVGALIGAAIAGAIIGSMNKNGSASSSSGSGSRDDGWWSPSGGVSCNSYQSACYENGRFSPRWTNRIYQ